MRPYLKIPTIILVVLFSLTTAGWAAPEVPQISGSAGAVSSVVNDTTNISMDFENASLKDILKVFSQLSRMNFVASSDIETKKATVYFDNVPIQDALNGLMAANNLRYEQQAGSKVFVVYSATGSAVSTMETRIFPLKYARLSSSLIDTGGKGIMTSGSSGTSSSSSGGSSSDSSGGGSSASTSSSGGSSSGSSSGSSGGRGIDTMISTLLSKNGKLTTDLAMNSLIITDTSDVLANIQSVLNEIDKPTPQVIIDIYLMEVKKDAIDNLGIEWGGDDGAFASFNGGTRTTGFPLTERWLSGNQGVKATTQAASAMTLGTLSVANFAATLHAITQLGDTRILAQPRVLTLSNEAAFIQLSTNAAVAKQVTTSAAQGQSTQTTNVADRRDVGISLTLTPQINRDESIVLYLQPSLTTAAASSFFPADFVDTTIRTVKTVARVKNHQTLVIGGLLDKSDARTKRKLPLLGDIPLFGQGFRYDTKNDQDRELVIFITPHIVEGYDSINRPSATSSKGRDMALERSLSAFQAYHEQKDAETLQESEFRNQHLLREESQLLKTKAKKTMTPALDRQMDRAMGVTGRK